MIALLVANLGLSAYIAFRPSSVPTAAPAKDATTTAISEGEANKLADTLVPLYNQKDFSALYDRFDRLAQAQFTKTQLTEQIEKLGSLLGRIEKYAYSHATVAGAQSGRNFYTLHFKVSLSGGPIPNGDMTLTVARIGDGLGLFGFFVSGGTARRS